MRIQVLLTAGSGGSPYSFRLPTCFTNCRPLQSPWGGRANGAWPLGSPAFPPLLSHSPLHPHCPLFFLPLSPSLADHSPCPGGSRTRSRLSTQETDTEGGKLLWFAPGVDKGRGRLPEGPGRLRNGWFGTWSWQDGREFVEQERGEISLGRRRIMCHHRAQGRE